MSSNHSKVTTEVDFFDLMAAKVRNSEPLVIQGPITGLLSNVHFALIERLKSETGLPVRVIYL